MQHQAGQDTPLDADRLIRAGQVDALRWRHIAGSSDVVAAEGGNLDAPALRDALSLAGYQVAGAVRRGGQSVVYEAIQRSTRRTVAIKVFHSHGDPGGASLRRFEHEAGLLTELRHPNIVSVYDAGVCGDRRYLVMDFVDGRPLDEYVAARGLPLRDVLRLFATICDAVNAAHLKGVIHRDLKPANILVRESAQDEAPPEPVVLDFGLAKRDPGFWATGFGSEHDLAPTLDFQVERGPQSLDSMTETGRFVGSLAWASPEQAAGESAKIDIRTDVYSLGVILYQLLTGGRFPYDVTGSMREVLNRIVTAAPLSPRTFRRNIDGEVETIVLKCLSKERARRYTTAGELAADIRRYLAREAIEAKRDSRWYVLHKTLRRHRAAVAVAAGAFLLIAAGLVATGTLWRQAEIARDSESEQRARAAAVSAFLTEMLTAAEPAKTKGAKLTVRESLDTAAKRIDEGSVKDQPLVEAEIRFTIGSTYHALGLCPEAKTQLRAADALQSRELGDEHPDTLRTRFKLAQTLALESDYADAAAIAQPTFEAQKRVLGPDDPDTLQSMVLLGSVLWAQVGRFAEAESLLRSAIERLERVRGPNDRKTAGAMNRLGEAYGLNSYPEKAEPLHREALRIHTEALGEEHPATLNSMFLLAQSLHNQNRPEEAVAIGRRQVELSLRVLGPEHVSTLAARGNLALSLNHLGRYPEAETMHHENLAALLSTAGPTHSNTITEKRYLAHCLECQGKNPEAEAFLREALGAAREKYGPEDANTSIKLMCALTQVLAVQRKDAEAEHVARQVLEFQHRQLPRTDPSLLTKSSIPLIQVLKRRGANDEALRIEQELIESWLAASHGLDASAQALIGAAHRLLYPENEQLRDAPLALQLALQANERSGQRNPRHLSMLAEAYHQTGATDNAIELQLKAVSLLAADAPDRTEYEDKLCEYQAASESPVNKREK